MKRKVLFCICIVQMVIIISLLSMILPHKFTIVYVNDVNLREYVNSYDVDNNYYPDMGYIPDVETAQIVGSAIIDKLTGRSFLGATTVTYDEENRLWKVEKNYLFSRGGFIVIEQDTGRIIKALLNK